MAKRYTQKQRDLETAMVFLGTHGSTTYPPSKWRGYAYAERDYAPEWAVHEYKLNEDDCVTVLEFTLSEIVPPKGYTIACHYAAGERDCPWCGEGTGEEHTRKKCKLCQGDGHLYWGEGCRVVVLQKASKAA